MCTTLFALNYHDDFPLIFLSNRDEFHERKTKHAFFRKEGWLGGKDLEAGGTWLGLHPSGEIANITNYRDFTLPQKEYAPSRGKLPVQFLNSADKSAWRQALEDDVANYNGFSFICGNFEQLYFLSNEGGGVFEKIENGIHGLSNHLLDSPWPKVEEGKKRLRDQLADSQPKISELFKVLDSEKKYPYEDLPKTGLEPEMEIRASSIFIRDDIYGTRTSTVILIRKDGHITYSEKNYAAGGRLIEDRTFRFNRGFRL